MCAVQVNYEALMRKNEIYLNRKNGSKLILLSSGGADAFPLLSYPVIDMTQQLPDPFIDIDVFTRSFAAAMDVRVDDLLVHIERILPICFEDCKTWLDFTDALQSREEKEKGVNAAAALAKIKEVANSLYDRRAEYVCLPEGDAILDFRMIDPTKKRFYLECVTNMVEREDSQPLESLTKHQVP
jgi:hypothetical protein